MSTARVDNKYCLPIIKKKRAEVQETIESNLATFRYFEVWLDYIEDLEPGFAASLVGLYPHRIVTVFRRQNLDPIKLPIEDRYQIIKTLVRKQVFVDLDITMQGEEITRAQAERLPLKTILSYHNYSFTPSDTELRSLTERMESLGAHIVKVSTHCSTQRDALRLLSLLIELRESGRKSIILGMGKHTVINRIFGTLWGNEMVFAPIDIAARSAPGQLAVDKLDSILKALG
jgi:3-dehydroquinate dehydratase-1